MQITELKEKYQTGSITLEEVIEIKFSLPFAQKKLLCNQILEASLTIDDNQIISCDYFMRKLMQDVQLVVLFTNLEFGEELVEEYDYLVESGILGYIIKNINKDEIDIIDELVSKEIEQKIRIGNSLENIIASKLEKLISKIPDEKAIKKLMNDFPKQINKIKPDNMSIIKDLFKQGDDFGK